MFICLRKIVLFVQLVSARNRGVASASRAASSSAKILQESRPDLSGSVRERMEMEPVDAVGRAKRSAVIDRVIAVAREIALSLKDARTADAGDLSGVAVPEPTARILAGCARSSADDRGKSDGEIADTGDAKSTATAVSDQSFRERELRRALAFHLFYTGRSQHISSTNRSNVVNSMKTIQISVYVARHKRETKFIFRAQHPATALSIRRFSFRMFAYRQSTRYFLLLEIKSLFLNVNLVRWFTHLSEMSL